MKKKNLIEFDVGLLILFIIIPNMPYAILTNEVISISTFLLISIIGVLFFRKYGIKINKIELTIIIGVIVFVLISCIKSSDSWLSISNSYMIISLIISYLYFKNGRNDDDILIKYMLIGGGINSVISLIRYIITYDTNYTRLEGILNYSNTEALYLAICSVIFLHKYHDILSYGNKNIYKITNLLVITCLFITQSRGGIIVYIIALILSGAKNLTAKLLYNALAIILATLIIKNNMLGCILFIPIALYIILIEGKKDSNEGKINKYVKVAVIISFIISIVYLNIGRFKEISLSSGEFQERLVFMEDGCKLIKANLLGIGAGNFNKQQFIYQSANYDIKYIHNGYIQYAVDYGLAFLIIFISIIINSYYKVIKNKNISNVWSIVFIMITIHSLVDFSLNFLIIGLFLTLCIFKINLNSNNSKYLNTNGIRYFAIIIIVCSLIFSLLLLPYQVMYNKAINDSNNKEYYEFKKLTNYIFKDNRYYFKKGVIALVNKDLIEAEESLIKYLSLEKNEIRGFEALAQVYLNAGKEDETENLINNLINIDNYYTKGYDMLFQVYYDNFKYYLTKNDVDKLKQEINKIELLNEKVEESKLTINKRAKYMKNQPTEYMHNKYNDFFKEVNEVKSILSEESKK